MRLGITELAGCCPLASVGVVLAVATNLPALQPPQGLERQAGRWWAGACFRDERLLGAGLFRLVHSVLGDHFRCLCDGRGLSGSLHPHSRCCRTVLWLGWRVGCRGTSPLILTPWLTDLSLRQAPFPPCSPSKSPKAGGWAFAPEPLWFWLGVVLTAVHPTD